MEIHKNPNYEEIASELLDIVNSAKAMDEKTHFINFDYIWMFPNTSKRLNELIIKLITVIEPEFEPSKYVLLCSDNLREPYGLIPSLCSIASRLYTHIAIWKEVADFSTGRGHIYGPTKTSLKCLVFQDIISRGTTMVKMAAAIKSCNWEVKTYFGLFTAPPLSLNQDESLSLLRSISNHNLDDIKFDYLARVEYQI
jgi:orotate phosphoribosyltransferase